MSAPRPASEQIDVYDETAPLRRSRPVFPPIWLHVTAVALGLPAIAAALTWAAAALVDSYGMTPVVIVVAAVIAALCFWRD